MKRRRELYASTNYASSSERVMQCPNCRSAIPLSSTSCPVCYTAIQVTEYGENEGLVMGDNSEAQVSKRTVGERIMNIDSIGVADERVQERVKPKKPHSIKCFLACYQDVLKYQLSYLVKEKKCSPMIMKYAGDVWFKYLSLIHIKRIIDKDIAIESVKKVRMEATERIAKAIEQFRQSVITGVPPSQQTDLTNVQHHLDIERELIALNSIEPTSDEMIDQVLNSKPSSDILTESYSMLRQHSNISVDDTDFESYYSWTMVPTPSDTLLFCYLACARAREPILLSDLRRWANDGTFPYRYVLAELAKNPKWKEQADNTLHFRQFYDRNDMHWHHFNHYNYFRMFTEGIPPSRALWKKLMMMKRNGLDVVIPSVHCESVTQSLCDKYLLLKASDPLRLDLVNYTCNLIALVNNIQQSSAKAAATINFWISSENKTPVMRQNAPEIYIAAYLIVALKLRFGLSENESMTDPAWFELVQTMLLSWNEKYFNLMDRILEKYQVNLSYDHGTVTPKEYLNILSAGSFENYINTEKSTPDVYAYASSKRVMLPTVLEDTVADELLERKESQENIEERNSFTELADEYRNREQELSEESKSDMIMKLVTEYYSKRYVKYLREETEEPFHIQFAFILESLSTYLQVSPDHLFSIVRLVEYRLFDLAHIRTGTLVDC
jgi:hypothetical protein